MRPTLLALVFSVAVAMLPAAASSGIRRAPLLPEVNKHLVQARSELEGGRFEIAAAHADVVLIGDVIRYSFKFETGVPESLKDACQESLEDALRNWEDSLDNSVRFVEASSPEEATIHVRFKRNVFMGSEPVAGFANWKRKIVIDGDRVTSATVSADLQIRTNNIDGRAMPIKAMTHEVMHEMGHVLGLEDCDDLGYLMGPLDVRRPVHAPLGHEADAVRDLRAEAKRLKVQSSAR